MTTKNELIELMNDEAEVWVRLNDEEGLWQLAGYKAGWFHVEQEGTTKNRRASHVASVVEVDGESDDEGTKGMAKTLDKYRAMGRYTPSVGPHGSKSESNHDAIANFLEGREPEEVMVLAERLLGLDRGFLMEKYGHLNRGQQRMNSGNRIRAALKRGELVVDEEGSIRTAH